METKLLVPTSPPQAALTDLVSRYRQLSHMIVPEKNRREKPTRQAVARTGAWIEETLQSWRTSANRSVDAMKACLKAEVVLSGRAEVPMSLKGSVCAPHAFCLPVCRNWGFFIVAPGGAS